MVGIFTYTLFFLVSRLPTKVAYSPNSLIIIPKRFKTVFSPYNLLY